LVIKTLSYRDNLLVPVEAKTWRYRGPNPMRIWKQIMPTLILTLEIDSPRAYNDLLLWDARSGTFQGKWRANKSFDRWTRFWVVINAWGKIDLKSPERMGQMTVKLHPYLETQVEYATDIQRALWWTYSYLFYNDRRRKWLAKSKDYYDQIENKLKKILGMWLSPTPQEKFEEMSAATEAQPPA